MTETQMRCTIEQWIRLHIRLAALEQRGPGLSHHFEFPDRETVVCNVYFIQVDDIQGLLEAKEKSEIYKGWIEIGKAILRRSLELAELSPTFTWEPIVRFVLHEGYGMGSVVVQRLEERFRWPLHQAEV